MKIRRLEIQGFKSFADRTVLSFGDGITGVVGPNGCGKSNVVDALRWAMGEQSAKHLRGNGMEDVIFAGSDSRGPLGLAEVTITFENDGALVPPEYQSFREISVTRRLFRDGTSEYLINKVQARLRDVVELFMGTGIGTRSYSIIEQGRIGLVVTAKPEDRRSLLEDAAGITKYKARRKQAERKMEAAEQNLLRVNDIVSELKKQLGSLERQAKKAEKYKTLKAELKQLELENAVHRHLELVALELFEERASLASKEAADRAEAEIADDELRIFTGLEAVQQRSEEVRGRELALAEVEQALAVGSKNLEHLERELAGLNERRGDARREKDHLADERVAVEKERTETAALLDTLVVGEAEEESAQAAAADALAAAEAEIAAREPGLEREKKNVVECLTQAAQHQNNLKNLGKAAGDLDARLARLHAESSEAERAQREADQAARDTETRLAGNRQLKLALDDRRTAQESLLEHHQAEFMQVEAQLLSLREELMDRRSRLSSLLEIQRNYEGCQQGVRAIMRHRTENPKLEKRVHGLVADVIASTPRFEMAVEAVLGERLQSVIVSGQEEGVQSIDYLKRSADGRSTFVPLDLREDHASWAPRKSHKSTISSAPPPQEILDAARAEEARGKKQDVVLTGSIALPVPELVLEEEDLWPDMSAPGVCGKMVDLIKAQPGFEPVARVLLGDVVVVEDLENARALWRSNGHRKTLVTLAGEVLDPVGIISGGAHQGVSAGMLAKKREIEELTQAVSGLEANVASLEARHAGLRARLAELDAAIEGLASQGHEEDLSIVKLERDVGVHQDAAARHAERRAIVAREIEQIAEERRELGVEIERSERAVAELEARRAAAEARATAEAVALAAERAKAADVGRRLTELKVASAAASEKRENARRSLARLDARLVDIDGRLSRLASNLDSGAEEAARMEWKIEEAREEKTRLSVEVETRKADLTGQREAVEAEAARLREEENAIREKRRSIEALRSSYASSQLKLREHQLARESLYATIENVYQLVLVEVVADHHLSAAQDERHQRRRLDLRRQIDNMGEINLTAIDEYAEVKQRHEFLTGQKKDLEDAISQLRSAIRKINRTSQERYDETFALVNEKFQKVFPRLFEGGKAELIMTDPSDPLESGLEMLVQPPGKKPGSVSLLSGGEKALTAVALIFSIFLIKPTPFCLLDEVDAPLDDANVGRYNEIVRDMSSISQFILITHNKRTMEIADRLYGVTMEEPGISKLVGVDIRETEQRLRSPHRMTPDEELAAAEAMTSEADAAPAEAITAEVQAPQAEAEAEAEAQVEPGDEP